MNIKLGNTPHYKASVKLALIFTLAWLLPSTVVAQVTGIWDTTALTRFDVTAIKAPGLVPEHSVSIADGAYEFGVNGHFTAGEISGVWRQKNSNYMVTADRFALENQYRLALESTPGMIVKQVKLLNSKLAGSQLDNGIWGSERYEYKIDISLNGRREVLRVVMASNVAGHQRLSNQAKASGIQAMAAMPQPDFMAAAVAVVVDYFNRH
ncbi:MAG: hypothetical protein NTV43_02655 [Methylococcales bacterium]|nr:hypothetical protein [Methylococcales bacterium]